MMLDLEVDRLIPLAAESPVDGIRERGHLVVEILVLVDDGTARRGDLNEREFSDPFRLQLEQALDRHQSLQDPLRIVQAVHAETEEAIRRDAVEIADMGATLGDVVLRVGPPDRPLDRNRVGIHGRQLAAVGDRRTVAVDSRLQKAIDAVQEVVAVNPRVESQNAAAQQPFQDLLLPRANAVEDRKSVV